MKRIAIYHLETLSWIARLGTFQAAAERLNTTQPAISARIREIEEQLGVKLFQKEGRRMVLTSRGRLFVKHCEPLWKDLEEALLEVSDYSGAKGTVRIGSGEIAAASCLPGFIQELERNLPGVTLEIEIDLTARMLQHVLAGTCDLVFLAGPVRAPGVQTANLGSIGLVWVASKTIGKMGYHESIPAWSLPSHSPIFGIVVDTLRRIAPHHPSINTCNNVRTLIEIVLCGRGVALLPETMIRRELSEGSLVEILPRPDRTIEFEAAIRKNEQDPVILELFRRASQLQIDPLL